mgnify:CR=1 FL=1
MTHTQILLVPGYWLGAWAWDEVVPLLRQRGHEVTALTLPGLEADSPTRGVTLQDHADAIAEALDEAATRRVLVVHSGAAVPGTLVLDQHPGLVDHVVWVDTAPAGDGFAMNEESGSEPFPIDAAWDEEYAQGSMRDLTDEQLTTFRERAVPEPGLVVSTPVTLTDDRRLDVPGTIICTAFSANEYRAYAEQGADFLTALPDYRALELVDLPTGHWPMWSRPQELADLIAKAAEA